MSSHALATVIHIARFRTPPALSVWIIRESRVSQNVMNHVKLNQLIIFLEICNGVQCNYLLIKKT